MPCGGRAGGRSGTDRTERGRRDLDGSVLGMCGIGLPSRVNPRCSSKGIWSVCRWDRGRLFEPVPPMISARSAVAIRTLPTFTTCGSRLPSDEAW